MNKSNNSKTGIWRKRGFFAAALCAAMFAQAAAAIPFPNPAPGTIDPDIDGTGYFQPSTTILGIEIHDGGDTVFEFGFFEKGNSGTLVPIFEASDTVDSQAYIDFLLGIVFDVDEDAIQNTFTPLANTIGFYLSLPNVATVLFSDPTLNPGGIDYSGAYPSSDVVPGAMSVMFWLPSATGAPPQLLTWHLLTTTSAVPSPPSVALMVLGLVLLGGRRAIKR